MILLIESEGKLHYCILTRAEAVGCWRGNEERSAGESREVSACCAGGPANH